MPGTSDEDSLKCWHVPSDMGRKNQADALSTPWKQERPNGSLPS